MSDAELTLALGPTNTGKTHRAVERMLEHDSGMIGLPLRLLAREVYDRITAQIGEAAVALVTGEEKRTPPRARYWVCTVEAMPTERVVDFVAVDEIQLAAHRERGHVFTDRLLRLRGRRETWFLGADTMAPIGRALLPDADLRRQMRFSQLRHTGRSGLGGLPPRTAVVAFSADEVYALAARLKARRGGAAVVLGALSPRTRNAQVALYQAREVQYIVATDAIGMGLNLDVDHVAFASLRKFDGKDQRYLAAPELAQIAGRAGRYKRDGSFGTLNPLPALDERVVRAIEEHRFPAVRRLVWRSAALDFESPEALIGSLSAPPPSEAFERVERADDFDALRALSAQDPVRERATSPDRVALLWEVCQVPDFRKLLLARHVSLLGEIYVQLVDHGRLDPGWVAAQVERIDRVDGEVDGLTARLSAIRVWTYVSHRAGWLEDAARWQERTRAIEDRLGDALHQRLVERFVEIGKKRSRAKIDPTPASGPFAQLRGMLEDAREDEDAASRRWVDDAIEAPHEDFDVDAAGVITFRGARVGALVRGRERHAPEARPELPEDLGAGARARLERRLHAFAKDWAAALWAPLDDADAEGALRGLLYQLRIGLGTVLADDAAPQLAALDPTERAALAERGVVLGQHSVYARPLLTSEALARRALLVALAERDARLPKPGAVSYPVDKRSAALAPALGFVPLGPQAVRADLVERVLEALGPLEPPFALPAQVRSWLGVPQKRLDRVLRALGYRRDASGWSPAA
ncbi:MAG: helicase-related protein [Sandaracinaceae bacterium]